jgi:ubiquinone/menaquinone biosynthesis C-methylase UbiE
MTRSSMICPLAASLLAAAFLVLAPPVAAQHDSHEGHEAHGAHGQAPHAETPPEQEAQREGVRVHSFEDTERWIERFESPERAAYQKPDEVVAALGLKPGQTAADIGAGSGYFTFRLARAVGPGGRVYAVDIEPGMVAAIGERAESEQGGDVVTGIVAEPDDPKLPDGKIDLVLVVNTIHHIENRVDYLGRLAEDLTPAGRVAIVDYKEGDLPVGPPAAHKLSRQTVIDEFAEAGYRLEREETFLPYQHFLIFSR